MVPMFSFGKIGHAALLSAAQPAIAVHPGVVKAKPPLPLPPLPPLPPALAPAAPLAPPAPLCPPAATPPVAPPPPPAPALVVPPCAPPLAEPPPPSEVLPLTPPLALPAVGAPPALVPAPPLALPALPAFVVPPADLPAVASFAPSSELQAARPARQTNNVGTAQPKLCVREVMLGALARGARPNCRHLRTVARGAPTRGRSAGPSTPGRRRELTKASS